MAERPAHGVVGDTIRSFLYQLSFDNKNGSSAKALLIFWRLIDRVGCTTDSMWRSFSTLIHWPTTQKSFLFPVGPFWLVL